MRQNYDITLLIVDDEPEIRSGLRTAIPWEDYGISLMGTAANGAEALDLILQYHPDIVITDIQMPVMDGLELVRQAREKQTGCSFVILSGYDDFNYAKTAIQYGVKDYLLKPIVIQELVDITSRLTAAIQKERSSRKEQLATLETLQTAKASIRQNQLIPELLHKELSEDELEKTIREYSLPIDNAPACMVLIQAFSSRYDSEEQDGQAKQALGFARQELERRLEGRKAIISERNDQKMLLIVNTPFEYEGEQALPGFLKDYLQDMAELTSLKLSAAIGTQVPCLMDIGQSYQVAGRALAWHIYKGIGPVISSSVLDTPAPPVVMPDSTILDALLQGDLEALTTHLDAYFQKLLYVPMPPPNYIYSMCNYLIIDLRNSLSKYMSTPPKSFSGDSFLTLQALETFDDVKLWMKDILSGFMNELQISRLQQADPIIEKAMDYVRSNICRKIRTEDVCAYIGLSKSYFSTYFKNKTHLNFRDYILDLKITYAQEHLKLPEHTPGELALMLGYEDYSSFSRAFKARTGFAPSDYQKKYISDAR